MATALDLLTPTVRDIRRDREDEALQAQRIATMTPDQQSAYMAYTGGRAMGKGLGEMVGGALGVDMRSDTQKYADAVAKVKAQVAAEKIDPTDVDKFYPRVIQLLGQNGLVAEAAQMSREYQKMKLEMRRAQLETAREERMARRDAASDARARERNEIAMQRLGAKGHEVVDLLNMLDQPDVPEERRKAILARINFLSQQKLVWKDLGDRIGAFNPDGSPVAAYDKGAAPVSQRNAKKQEEVTPQQITAYKMSKDRLQRIYDTVTALANHPGLHYITGRVMGATGGEGGVGGPIGTALLPDAGRAALALLEQITGQAFLNALAELRSLSKSGASGLGAVTEREGDRLVSSAAALNRQQDTATFHNNLKKYASDIVLLGARMDENAGTDDLVVLREVPIKLSGTKGAPAKPTADASPRKPSAPDDIVRVTKDGVFAGVKRSELEAAKKAGWTEVR